MVTFNDFMEQYGWIVIFGIIILFTILTMLYYSKKDKYDPEPPGRLIFAFFLGILSVIPALIMSLIGAFIVVIFGGAGVGTSLLLSVVVAPVTEEIAKLWFVIYLAKSDVFDGPLDGLVYGAMVGAGFAAAENLLYGFGAVVSGGIVSGVTLTAFRSLLLIVGHPLYTGLAGVGVGEWKVGLESNKYNKIWRSMAFHGLWNLSANLGSLLLLFGGLIIVIGINVYVLRRELKRTLALDKDAYDRGYYDQKQKMLTQKRQRIKQQINQMSQPSPSTSPGQSSSFQQSPDPWVNQQRPAKPIVADDGPNFCKNCGTKRQEGDIFCRTCGYRMIQP